VGSKGVFLVDDSFFHQEDRSNLLHLTTGHTERLRTPSSNRQLAWFRLLHHRIQETVPVDVS
jgi:hypothetical protein